jgi:hypothetical protein
VPQLPPREDHERRHLPGNVTVPSLGQRMSCTKCGTVGADCPGPIGLSSPNGKA